MDLTLLTLQHQYQQTLITACVLQVFIFPGVGFGAVMVKAKEVTPTSAPYAARHSTLLLESMFRTTSTASAVRITLALTFVADLTGICDGR